MTVSITSEKSSGESSGLTSKSGHNSHVLKSTYSYRSHQILGYWVCTSQLMPGTSHGSFFACRLSTQSHSWLLKVRRNRDESLHNKLVNAVQALWFYISFYISFNSYLQCNANYLGMKLVQKNQVRPPLFVYLGILFIFLNYLLIRNYYTRI